MWDWIEYVEAVALIFVTFLWMREVVREMLGPHSRTYRAVQRAVFGKYPKSMRPRNWPPDYSSPQKWGHISDGEREKFFELEGMEVKQENGAWYLIKANKTTVTLGDVVNRSEALWVAYDLVKDPPLTHEQRAEFERSLHETEQDRQKLIWNRQRTWIAKKF